MKQLKSSLGDLREIFEKGITARHITEPFCSFDESAIAHDVKEFLEEKDYDVVGVRKKGVLNGYAYKKDLAEGQLRKYYKSFDPGEILSDTISISEVLKVIIGFNHVFISSFGNVAGIITRGDLQKIPMRMWLFSLISLIEMQMLRIIRDRYPEKCWVKCIDDKRIKRAKNDFNRLRKNNEEIDLVDCLQFFDKYTIISKKDDLLKMIQYNKNDFCTDLEDLKNLRNKLAHAQDIFTANYTNIMTSSKKAELLLKKFEDVKPLMYKKSNNL